MALFIHILSGEKFGQKYKISEGIRIGRSKGEVRISDPRVSSLHAEVHVSPLGGFLLVDKGSTHGIRSGNHKIKELLLSEGVRFELGKTLFEVIESAEELEASGGEKFLDQKEVFNSLIKSLSLLRTKNSPKKDLAVFNPALRLGFVEGLEYNRSIYLGYGPRAFGAISLDIELLEPACPDYAFDLIPENGQARLVAKAKNTVQINDSYVDSAVLKQGDRIRVGNTVIRVQFEYVRDQEEVR